MRTKSDIIKQVAAARGIPVVELSLSEAKPRDVLSPKALRGLAQLITDKTRDAYSFERYAPGAWAARALLLLKRGLDAREVEAVLRSKHMRWARDLSDKSSNYTSADLERYLVHNNNEARIIGKRALRELVAETFDDGSGPKGTR